MDHTAHPMTLSRHAARSLAADLHRHADAEVRFDSKAKALYATDSSNYRQVPIGVVIPRSREALIAAVAICREHDVPLLPRGGGTSLAGQSCNVAVLLDCSKYLNRVIEIDPERRQARVEPGCIFDHMRDAARPYGLTAGFDTSTHDRATVGGMLGNNSCGVHSVLAANEAPGTGRAADSTHSLRILTYDGLEAEVGRTPASELARIALAGGRRGEIYRRLLELRDRYGTLIRERYPHIPRRVSGYNLNELLPENDFHVARALVGTEGTCVTILEATVELVPDPPQRAILLLGYPDVYATGDHTSEVMQEKPVGLEALDGLLIENMKRKGLHTDLLHLLPKGGGWLLAEFGGDTAEAAEAAARRALDAVRDKGGPCDHRIVTDPHEQRQVWIIRESGLGATAFVPGWPDTWEGWEDSAVPPERLGDYLRDLRALFHRYGYRSVLYGHFGQGCVHCRISFDLRTPQGIDSWRHFLDDAADLVVRYGGSLSGEHGDGQAKAQLLEKMYGPEIIQAFREFKAIWDPRGRMNPGKVVDPYPPQSNLRLGGSYAPAKPVQTYFSYPDDKGDFARALLRCVGVGKCRHHDGGLMCPSFMVTHDENDVTRGRARSLFEMIHGGPIEGGWRSPEVRQTLDLCLACKGCKHDCPTNVDMATYKAEFMAHHYAGRLRPRAFYAMGLIHRWARLASHAPGLANFVLRAPGLSDIAKRLGGIASERRLPPLAREDFKSWFRRRRPGHGGEPVILFPDTFTNHFHPQVPRAAVEVLEAAGYAVQVPEPALCCGRALYDKGFVPLAKTLLRGVMDELGPAAQAGWPIVGLEPACVASFKDELVNLFPDDPRAHAICRRTHLFTDFLQAGGWAPPPLERKALLHVHCHQYAVIGADPARAFLEAAGLEVELPDAGCCGMAGAFGFEDGHYETSIRAGERVLLPAVRRQADDTLIVATGFSCREQITQTTNRRALHPAEVSAMALHQGMLH